MGSLKHKETKIARDAMKLAKITGGRIYTQESVGGLAGNGMNCLLHALYGKSATQIEQALNANVAKGYHFQHMNTWNKVFHSFILVKNKPKRAKKKVD